MQRGHTSRQAAGEVHMPLQSQALKALSTRYALRATQMDILSLSSLLSRNTGLSLFQVLYSCGAVSGYCLRRHCYATC